MSIGLQTVRLSRLTADLRKIAELETRPLEYVNINLPEILQETVTLVEEQWGEDARTLLVTLPQAPWPSPIITGDWDLIFLAVYNLVENAVKFTATSPKPDAPLVAFDILRHGYLTNPPRPCFNFLPFMRLTFLAVR